MVTGDIDGDGHDDVAIGAYTMDLAGTSVTTGRVYVVLSGGHF